MRKQKGFTLIELLIVVAIIGILAAIAIPNLLTAMQRSKQKRSMADMRTIATAWEARATDVNKYNAAGITIPSVNVPNGTLDTMLAPTYVKVLPSKDGWGNPYYYTSDVAPAAGAAPAQQYAITCYGRDGVGQTPVSGATTNFDCDIVYSQGTFLVYPEGVQQQ